MKSILEKVTIFITKWVMFVWILKKPLIFIIIFSFATGYISSPGEKIIEVIKTEIKEVPVIEENKVCEKKSKEVSGSNELISEKSNKTRIEIEQSTCCFEIMENTIIVSTKVWLYDERIPRGFGQQEHFISSVKPNMVDDEKIKQMKLANELEEKIKKKLNI